jgi:peptidylprolyl isomerase
LELFSYSPDEEAAQYIATVVEHRGQRDLYDIRTAEGGAKLIDVGVKYVYLFQAAARSAVVSGEFQLANKLYQALDDEQKEDVDRVLASQLEQLEADYLAEQEIRKREADEDRLPRIRLRTTRGDAVLELFIDNAPSTVSHFITLVEDGFYDGLDFHQVIDHLLALTGDPAGDGTGSSGQMLVDEHTRPDARNAFRGSLVMAKRPIGPGQFAPNTASSQFAILFLPLTQVTDQQTVFGRVIEGMDVISSLRRIDPSKEKKKDEIQIPPDRILSAEVIRRPQELPPPVYAP